MAAYSFPSSPTVGQTATINSRDFIYDGKAWMPVGGGVSPTNTKATAATPILAGKVTGDVGNRIEFRAGQLGLGTGEGAINTSLYASNPEQVATDGHFRVGNRLVLGNLNETPAIFQGTGAPSGVHTAYVGAIYLQSDGGAGTTAWFKESGAGTTDGWVNRGTGGGGGSSTPTYASLGNAGTSKAVSITNADFQDLTLNSASCTLTFTGTPAANTVREWVLRLIHDATGSARAIVWPAVKWENSTLPFTPTTEISSFSTFAFITLPSGVHIGYHTGNFFP